MAVPGDPHDERIAALHEAALERAGTPLDFFDAHTHLGHDDPDGFEATPEEIVAGLDRGGQRRALIFPMQEPGGYPEANDRAIAAAHGSGGRLEALARIDPNTGEAAALAEAERCLAAGARGFKLHPRSDSFDMPHPVVERIVELASQHRAPVLFHAGRGFPGLGEEVAHMARRHRGARLILAHAGISDLGHLAEVVAEAPNIFFDTSWWLVADMLTLFTSVPPGRVLYASDMPYGAARYSALRDVRCAVQVGLGPAALRSIAGEQLDRIVTGAEPLDLGPAPGTDGLGVRDLAAERGIAYLATACQLMWRHMDPTEPLSLARLALRHDPRPFVQQADELAASALEAIARHGLAARPGLQAANAAQLVLGTPAAS